MTVRELQQELKQLLKEGNITEDSIVTITNDYGETFNISTGALEYESEQGSFYWLLDIDKDDMLELE